jgi:hypothetical protein
MRDCCATGSNSEFTAPVELLLLPGTCTGSRTCISAGSCARAPLIAPLVPSFTPILTLLHAGSLGLGIGYCQCGSGCCDGEGSSFSERALRREIASDLLISLMVTTPPGECPRGCNSKVTALI